MSALQNGQRDQKMPTQPSAKSDAHVTDVGENIANFVFTKYQFLLSTKKGIGTLYDEALAVQEEEEKRTPWDQDQWEENCKVRKDLHAAAADILTAIVREGAQLRRGA